MNCRLDGESAVSVSLTGAWAKRAERRIQGQTRVISTQKRAKGGCRYVSITVGHDKNIQDES